MSRGRGMRRRDFTTGLLPVSAVRIVTAQEPAKRHRIAIVEAGSVTGIDEPGSRLWQPFWKVFRLLGDAEGQNLIVERYAGEGRHEGYGNLARQIVNRNPDMIVAVTDPIARAVRAAIPTDQVLVPDQSESRQSLRPYPPCPARRGRRRGHRTTIACCAKALKSASNDDIIVP